MDSQIRRVIYFIMVTLVINAGGWTFNKEAVADVWFGDERQETMVSEDTHHSGAVTDHAASTEVPCNHWCHVIGHFAGVFRNEVFLTPKFTNEFTPSLSVIITPTSLDGLFRPPRRFS